MTHRTKVLIVDDHPLFRGGLRQVILDDGRFELIGETGDGEDALRLIQEKKPDVAVLDVKLPGLTGLEIARKLQEKRSRTHVIMLTMHNEEDLFNRALDSGAMGFVLKENAVEEIVKAIVAVADGQHYLSSTISGYLVRRRNRAESLAKEKPGLDDLTKAELRILKLISMKKTSREIGAELFISPRTVEAHRANICSKLGLRGSHSLLQFALENRSSL
ncbi:MAG TPA: response regulator transcription factor [Candidatus Acidoferrales bacterium]|jgi:DNA-binding NarL/FixJ family response regulator|nr:response regulator transcription factor [Candidatus Acidoferrales bacterium]